MSMEADLVYLVCQTLDMAGVVIIFVRPVAAYRGLTHLGSIDELLKLLVELAHFYRAVEAKLFVG